MNAPIPSARALNGIAPANVVHLNCAKVIMPAHVDIRERKAPNYSKARTEDAILDEALEHKISIPGVKILTNDQLKLYKAQKNEAVLKRLVIDTTKVSGLWFNSRSIMTFGHSTIYRLKYLIYSLLINRTVCPFNDIVLNVKNDYNITNSHMPVIAHVIPDYHLDEVESLKQGRPIWHVYVRFVVDIPNTNLEFQFSPIDSVDAHNRKIIHCKKNATKKERNSNCKCSGFYIETGKPQEDTYYTDQYIFLFQGFHQCEDCCYIRNSILNDPKAPNRNVNHTRWTHKRAECEAEIDNNSAIARKKRQPSEYFQ